MSFTLGDRVGGRYRVLESLGSGGMATVFTVTDERAGVRRVLKQLRADGAAVLEAFRSEFSLLSRVTHPRLTRVFDFGSCRVRSELLHYYIADWIDGRTLDAHAREHPEAAVGALVDALEGLSVLHAVGIRHGDFTPANVIVDAAGHGTLIDLGCARAFGERSDVISGTPGFIAPELLETGTADARADLFAVGTTLRQILGSGSSGANGRAAALVQRLVERNPADRPTSVGEVIESLSGRRFERAARIEAHTLVGRERELGVFESWLARVRDGVAGPRVFSIHGRGGVGLSRFFRECVARAELQLPLFRAHAGEIRPVRWLLSHVLEDFDGWSSARIGLAAARSLEHQSQPLLLALEDAHRLEPAELELLLGCARSLADTARAGLIVCSREALPGTAAETVALRPLDAPALRVWTGNTLSKHALAQVLNDTGGLPAAIEAELLRIARARGGKVGREASEGALQATVAQLSLSDIERLALVLALDGDVDVDVAASSTSLALGEDPLLDSGLLQRDGARLRLRRTEHLDALRAMLPANALANAHRMLAEKLLGSAQTDGRDAASSAEMIRHLALAGEIERAEARLAESEAELSSDPGVFARRSLPLLWRSKRLDTLVSVARLLLLGNEPHLALSAVARVLRLRSTAEASAEARLLGAEALLRLGRSRRAERLLRRVQASALPPALRARAFEWLARAHMQGGDHAQAVLAVEEGLALSPPPAHESTLLEVLGVANSYLGRTEQAELYFARVLATLDETAQPRAVCRLLGYRAISAFRSGRVARAAEDHARALELAERHALDDLVAVSSLNLGTAQQQLGDLGAALASYERGLAMARAIGRESTELTLRYNLANLRTELGDVSRARDDIEALERRAEAAGFSQFAAGLALLRAELAVLSGEHGKAQEELDRAARIYAERGLSRELIEVDTARSELELSRGSFEAAEDLASKAQTAAEGLGATDLSIRAAIVIARTEVERRDARALSRLNEALERATAAKQRLLEARILTELWQAADTLARPDAADLLERARRGWDRAAKNLPEELRAVFFQDARRARLSRSTQQLAVGAGDTSETEALRRLLSLSRRMNSSLSLERVLDYAVDAAVDLSGAERGILLLADGDEPRVAAARPSSAQGDPPSRSIVGRVLESEDAVMATDVQSDARFAGQRSVHALRLKSVLCVPVSNPNGILGVLYVDSRVQRARFGERDRGVLQALADQVAVAITNARLHSELERHARELAEQKQTIERLSQRKDRELERLREQLDVQRRALGLRYDYAQIVGRGPKMRAVLEKLDRIIDSNASVLVQGESGTGKELVARAIHVHGARREGPFVGVNCAALPETLLESELFGHVRGAFTGADRDKKGLMLAANGGTLFLDEVGEMPLATQSRLLRVLQEREVRPVGSTRAVPLETRLLCATHRDLRAEVAAGRFREDLFYRIAVVVIVVPPLRERQEDLPALCRSILSTLAREAGTEPSELDRDALRLLAAHPFPGNVRELVNILTRAFVLRSGSRITASDLDLSGSSRRQRHTESRGEFEAEERQVILAALTGARWNVSTVARQLGIPRNTLYRKLRKYGLARQDPP